MGSNHRQPIQSFMMIKRLLVAAALFLTAHLPTAVQAGETQGNAERAVLKLEQQWEEALTGSNVAALERLYDESIVYTHSNGKVDTKASYIASIKSGATKYQSMKRDDIKVNVYGGSAVVTCHWEVHVLAGTNKIDTNARYIHVYVQEKDGWKMVAHQSTKIAP